MASAPSAHLGLGTSWRPRAAEAEGVWGALKEDGGLWRSAGGCAGGFECKQESCCCSLDRFSPQAAGIRWGHYKLAAGFTATKKLW